MKIKIIGALLLAGAGSVCFSHAQKVSYSLNFNPKKYEKQTLEYHGQKFEIRAFEKVVYVQNPVDTTYEVMNIYIPEAYFNGQSINGYTASTAPIFFPNQVGGYMPATPASTRNSGFMPPMNGGVPPRGSQSGMPPQGMQPRGREGNGGPVGGFGNRENTVLAALAKGYVVASAGARGRTTKNADEKFTGKAPAAIVDLKAAIRYLKYNDAVMPGDANKIISNGTSAGGAMSALLGATGDNPDYLPYLNALGAAHTSDAIFASSDYCPITNLDHADAAYEWQFNGIDTYASRGFGPQQSSASNRLTAEQIAVSLDLKRQFPAYINSLHLKDKNGTELTLNADGKGSFAELVKSYVIASANIAISGGANLSQHTWLTFQNGKVTDLDWDAYVQYMERQKTPPAFDALDISSAENSEFGTETIDKQHFTDYGLKNSAVASTKADEHIIKMMNPMYYIGTPNTTTAKYWRIRHGSKDKDTGLAIPVILATMLQNNGASVDFALPWDRPHSGDYDLAELFQWIDSISQLSK